MKALLVGIGLIIFRPARAALRHQRQNAPWHKSRNNGGRGAIEKLIGIIAGTFLSLVFVPPRTIKGFVRRTAAAIVFGWIFGHIFLALLLRWTGFERTPEDIVAAWAIAAFSSWIAMGAYTKHVAKRSKD